MDVERGYRLKNIQAKQVSLSLDREKVDSTNIYMDQELLCFCLPACLCKALDSTKIDSRSKDVVSKMDKRTKSLYLSLERVE